MQTTERLRALDPTLLRCPVTRSKLTPADGWLVTDDGAHRYPVRDGVPVLLGGERVLRGTAVHPPPGVAARADLAPPGLRARARAAGRRLADALPGTPVRNVGTERRIAELRRLLHQSRRPGADPARVLVVGGATAGIGTQELLDDPELEVVELDVVDGPRTTVIGDAHALPFGDGTFDAALCQGVLGFVVDPAQAVSEIHRVLRPGGLFYSETPFLQQVCNGAHDLTRWTLVGHRMLLREFDVIESGAHNGPGMATAWSISYLLMAMTGRSRLAHALMRRFAALLTWWLPLLDERLAAAPGGTDAASGTYVLGRRREQPLSDEDVLSSYRGAVVPTAA